jgi:nicotinamidase-related amidase
VASEAPVAEDAARLDRERSVLLIVDAQARLAPHIADHEAVLARLEALASAARGFGIPVLATEHCPEQLGTTVAALREPLPRRAVLAKRHFGAADEPALRTRLQSLARTQVVIAGMEAHVCVMQTALGLRALGYAVWIAADAAGSRPTRQSDRAWALDRLVRAGCVLAGTETVLFEWLADAADPQRPELIQAVKRLP